MAEEDGFDIGAKAEALLCMRYWDDGIDDDFDPTSWARGSLRPPVVGGTLELQNVSALIRRFQNGASKSVLKTLATAHTSREIGRLREKHSRGEGGGRVEKESCNRSGVCCGTVAHQLLMNVSHAMPLLPRRRPPACTRAPGSDDESNSPSPLPLPLLSLALPNCRACVCARACYRQTSFPALSCA